MKSSNARMSGRLLAAVVGSVGLLVFALANAHLIYVAFATEPECVPHLPIGRQTPGAYSAATSSC